MSEGKANNFAGFDDRILGIYIAFCLKTDLITQELQIETLICLTSWARSSARN